VGGSIVPALSGQEGLDGHHAALAAIGHEFPLWQAWEGVIAGLLYARRPNCSPPMVVRSTTTDGLRREIESAERERGLRP